MNTLQSSFHACQWRHVAGPARIAGWCGALAAMLWSSLPTAQTLTYDTSFATNGHYSSGLSGDDIAKALALHQGKVYVAGVCPAVARPPLLPAKPACVLRLLANGQVDTSFNGGNTLITSGRVSYIVGDGDTDVHDMVVSSDGKVTVSGRCIVSNVPKACLLRLLPNGSADTGFGANGRAYLDLATTNHGDALPLLAEAGGSVLLASALETTYAPGVIGYDVLIRRVSATGSATQFGRSTITPGVGAAVLAPRVLLRQSDGSIVVALDAHIPSVGPVPGAQRFFAGGTWENTYGGTPGFPPLQGFLPAYPVSSGTGIAPVSRAALTADDTLVITMRFGNSTYYAAAVGVYATPNPAAIGGTNDWLRFRVPDLGIGFTTTTNRGVALAVTADNKLLIGAGAVAGYTAFARLNIDGTFDSSFPGTSPDNIPNTNPHIVDAGIALQPDRKVVTAGNGSVSNDFVVGRLNRLADSLPACTPDVDGDGVHSATVDGLLWSRALFGLSGAGVTGGITFPVGASRTSWSAIRAYLVGECGMTLPP
ncbi:MAG: hypothetical protein JNL19_07650 [Burkholderiales bacterium]|nr:hypothetical protein [Burkholderiales bacterium]